MTYPSLLRRYLATSLDVIFIVLILYAYAQSPISKTANGSRRALHDIISGTIAVEARYANAGVEPGN
jgi:uncharacterized RDD family membrane protein YckC